MEEDNKPQFSQECLIELPFIELPSDVRFLIDVAIKDNGKASILSIEKNSGYGSYLATVFPEGKSWLDMLECIVSTMTDVLGMIVEARTND